MVVEHERLLVAACATMTHRAVLLAAILLAGCQTKSDMQEPPLDASDVRSMGPKNDASSSDTANRPLDGSTPATTGDARVTQDATSTPTPAQPDASAAPISEAELETLVYVGGAGSPYPFRTYKLDRASGKLTQVGEPTDMGPSPSYIASDKAARYLYIANEDDGTPGLTVAKVDARTGQLTRIDQERHMGGGLVFSSVDPSDRHVLAADYNQGKAVVYRIGSDGTLSSKVAEKTFGGNAHSHAIRVHPNGKWAYVPNKDGGNVAQFAYDETTGALTELSPATVAADQGPRHLAFHPSGAFVYVILEYGAAVRTYKVESSGTLTQIDEKASLLSGSPMGGNPGAHILVHPSGKFLYASIRGNNQLAVFTLGADGKPTLLANTKTGKTPRNFDIDSQGQFLIAAGEGDGTLTTYAIGSDGQLTPRDTPITGLGAPKAVLIINRKKAQ